MFPADSKYANLLSTKTQINQKFKKLQLKIYLVFHKCFWLVFFFMLPMC